MTTKEKRCPVCHSQGCIHCGCWPGDCICGQGDEDCEFCEGAGWVEFDGEERDYGAQTITRPRAAATNIGE